LRQDIDLRVVVEAAAARYGNFDTVLDHFSRLPQAPTHPTRAVQHALLRAHADRVMIGAVLQSDAIATIWLQVMTSQTW